MYKIEKEKRLDVELVLKKWYDIFIGKKYYEKGEYKNELVF